MSRGFLLLLGGLFATVFAAAWQLAGPAGPPPPTEPPVRTADGRSIVPKSCEEAEELGVAPLMSGRPGYTRDLDPDGDGLACVPMGG